MHIQIYRLKAWKWSRLGVIMKSINAYGEYITWLEDYQNHANSACTLICRIRVELKGMPNLEDMLNT